MSILGPKGATLAIEAGLVFRPKISDHKDRGGLDGFTEVSGLSFWAVERSIVKIFGFLAALMISFLSAPLIASGNKLIFDI